MLFILYAGHLIAFNKSLNPSGQQTSIFKVKLDKQQVKIESNKAKNALHSCSVTDTLKKDSKLPLRKQISELTLPKYLRYRSLKRQDSNTSAGSSYFEAKEGVEMKEKDRLYIDKRKRYIKKHLPEKLKNKTSGEEIKKKLKIAYDDLDKKGDKLSRNL